MQTLPLPTLSFAQAARQLLEGSLAVRIALPGVTARAVRIMELMQASVGFLRELQAKRQERYMVLRPPFDQPNTCDDGWIVRRGKTDNRSVLRDQKIYFHCRPLLRRWIAQNPTLHTGWFLPLLNETESLRTMALQASLALGRAIDEALGCKNRISERLLAERHEFGVRVLQYLDQGSEGQLGNPHWDKSLFTLQLGQSIDGLVLIDPFSGEPFSIETEPETAVAFLGKQSRILLGEQAPLAEPIEHYIRDVREAGDRGMRNGIVSFAHAVPAEQVLQIRGDTAV